MNTEDRRVKKTRKALQVALAELLAEKDIHQITVQELADRADVHRATFYAHYQDVYDLLEQLKGQIISELRAMIVGVPSHDYKDLYKAIIDYIWNNPAYSKMIIGLFDNQSFRKEINLILEEQYLKIWLFEDNITEITEDMRYLTAYNIGGCVSILSRWIETNFLCSKEKIYELLGVVNDAFDKI